MRERDYPYLSNEERVDNKKKKNKKVAESIHHILAQGRWWSDVPQNRKKLFHRVHEAIHMLFGNADLIGKIDRLLDLEHTALNEEVLIDVEKLVKRWRGKQIYLDDVYKDELEGEDTHDV